MVLMGCQEKSDYLKLGHSDYKKGPANYSVCFIMGKNMSVPNSLDWYTKTGKIKNTWYVHIEDLCVCCEGKKYQINKDGIRIICPACSGTGKMPNNKPEFWTAHTESINYKA